jgi:hypothetical protein
MVLLTLLCRRYAPGNPGRLGSQVYRCGVSLGGTLTKQLLTGPAP